MGAKNKEINLQIPQLLADLQSNDQEKQLRAVQVAGEQKIIQASPVLINLLENIFDPYESVARQLIETTVWALGEIGDPQAIPCLMASLHNAFYKVQAKAITALGKMRAKEAVQPLWEIIQNITTPQFIRIVAVESLGRIADQTAKAHLQALAESLQVPRPLQEKASQMLHSIQGFW